MRHTQPNPFPIVTSSGEVIVNELCTCGAPRSAHEDTVSWGHGPAFGADGRVVCEKYTFRSFLYASKREAQRIRKERAR